MIGLKGGMEMQEKKTIICLIRHGESEANRRDAFLGHGNLELTETGRAQAEMAAAFLEKQGADVIYSSDLIRAHETAKAAARRLGLPVITDPQLREIDAGAWDFLTFAELRERFAESFRVWTEDLENAVCDGGESLKQLRQRILSAVTRIAEENKGKRVLIFSHGTPIRLMGAHAMGKGLGELPWPANASATTLEYENGCFRMVEYSREDYMGELVTKLPDNV